MRLCRTEGAHFAHLVRLATARYARSVRLSAPKALDAAELLFGCAEGASYALQVRRMRTNSKCAGMFKKIKLAIFF